VLGTEERGGPFAGEVFDLVDDPVAAVVAAAGIALEVKFSDAINWSVVCWRLRSSSMSSATSGSVARALSWVLTRRTRSGRSRR
jgi:hypothetical protein